MVVKILVVYNPRSGRQRKKKAWYWLHKYLSPAQYHLDRLDLTQEDLAKKLAHGHYDLLVVIGGDGTLRSVVDHLQKKNLKIPIALIPYGSANLIATSLNLPAKLQNISTAIQENRKIAIDIAQLTSGQYFIGAFAMGYISDRIVNTDRAAKRRIGFFSYIVSFIKQTKLPLHSFDIVVDGRQYSEKGHSLFIVNTANIFGFKGRRQIDYCDGIFELVITTNRSFWSLCGLIYDFYFRRKEPKHFILIKGKEFSVHTSDRVSTQIDGQKLTEKHQVNIKVLSKKQEFIIL